LSLTKIPRLVAVRAAILGPNLHLTRFFVIRVWSTLSRSSLLRAKSASRQQTHQSYPQSSTEQ
jgi:hypothetical protein